MLKKLFFKQKKSTSSNVASSHKVSLEALTAMPSINNEQTLSKTTNAFDALRLQANNFEKNEKRLLIKLIKSSAFHSK